MRTKTLVCYALSCTSTLSVVLMILALFLYDEDILTKFTEDDYLLTSLTKPENTAVLFYSFESNIKDLDYNWDRLEETMRQDEILKHVYVKKIECTVFKPICSQFNVEIYPRLAWMQRGKIIEIFEGDLSSYKSLKSFVDRMSQNYIKATTETPTTDATEISMTHIETTESSESSNFDEQMIFSVTSSVTETPVEEEEFKNTKHVHFVPEDPYMPGSMPRSSTDRIDPMFYHPKIFTKTQPSSSPVKFKKPTVSEFSRESGKSNHKSDLRKKAKSSLPEENHESASGASNEPKRKSEKSSMSIKYSRSHSKSHYRKPPGSNIAKPYDHHSSSKSEEKSISASKSHEDESVESSKSNEHHDNKTESKSKEIFSESQSYENVSKSTSKQSSSKTEEESSKSKEKTLREKSKSVERPKHKSSETHENAPKSKFNEENSSSIHSSSEPSYSNENKHKKEVITEILKKDQEIIKHSEDVAIIPIVEKSSLESQNETLKTLMNSGENNRTKSLERGGNSKVMAISKLESSLQRNENVSIASSKLTSSAKTSINKNKSNKALKSDEEDGISTKTLIEIKEETSKGLNKSSLPKNSQSTQNQNESPKETSLNIKEEGSLERKSFAKSDRKNQKRSSSVVIVNKSKQGQGQIKSNNQLHNVTKKGLRSNPTSMRKSEIKEERQKVDSKNDEDSTSKKHINVMKNESQDNDSNVSSDYDNDDDDDYFDGTSFNIAKLFESVEEKKHTSEEMGIVRYLPSKSSEDTSEEDDSNNEEDSKKEKMSSSANKNTKEMVRTEIKQTSPKTVSEIVTKTTTNEKDSLSTDTKIKDYKTDEKISEEVKHNDASLNTKIPNFAKNRSEEGEPQNKKPINKPISD